MLICYHRHLLGVHGVQLIDLLRFGLFHAGNHFFVQLVDVLQLYFFLALQLHQLVRLVLDQFLEILLVRHDLVLITILHFLLFLRYFTYFVQQIASLLLELLLFLLDACVELLDLLLKILNLPI